SAVGLLFITAWIFDISFLKNFSSSWISIKFITALCFFLTGIKLYFMLDHQKGKVQPAQIILSATSLIIILIMATLLAAFFFGIRTGIEDLFIEESSGAVQTPEL